MIANAIAWPEGFMTPKRIHRMGRLTQAEFDALPLRSTTSDYVEGITYRDAGQDLTTFLYLGPEADTTTAFLGGKPGLRPLDAWRVRKAVIVSEDDLRRLGDLPDGDDEDAVPVDNRLR